MKTKKELKAGYRELKFKAGVYQIRNKANGKIFLDSSVNLDASFNRATMELGSGTHRNERLQADWKIFGADQFEFSILAEVQQKHGETPDLRMESKDLEKLYFEELKPFGDRGYHKIP